MVKPAWIAILRDLTLLAVGIFGILYQLITDQVNPLLLTVFTAMLGIPGLTNGLWLLKQGGEQLSSGSRTPSPSSASSSPPSGGISDDPGD